MVEKANDNKTLWLGLAAAGALIGAALIFHWATSDEDEEEGSAPKAGNQEKLTQDL